MSSRRRHATPTCWQAARGTDADPYVTALLAARVRLKSSTVDTMTPFWMEMPKAGEVLWEFVRPSDKKKLRCELRAAAPRVWQVIVYQDGDLLAWHSGFSMRDGAERWARSTK